MSIYPVRLSEWYPPSKEKEDKNLHEFMRLSVKYMHCYKCDKKHMDWRYAWGHHSLPWGYGDVWCTTKCYKQWQKDSTRKNPKRRTIE